ncbi:hypothetical protein ACP275_02G137600 [Erythranthe tilingii]
MGRITSELQKQTPTTVTHFSHPHPLTLINTDHHHQQQQTLNLSSSSSCSGCSLSISGTIYSCTICKDFFLHKKCFDMPKKITHPFHKEHALTLLPVPAYEDGQFKCDACGEAGKCFSYHCKPCGVDLHVLCAAVPLTLTHASHHMHKLDLTFESPYDTKDFSCDICKKPGGDHWLYRCSPCGFDAHLSCARGAPPVSPRLHQQNVRTNLVGFQSQTPPPQQFTAFTRSAPVPPPPVQGQGFGPQFGGAPPPQIQSFGPQFGAAPPPPPQMQGFGPQFGGAPQPMQQNFGPPPPMMNNPAIGFPAGGPNHPHLVANRQHSEYMASYNATLQQIMGQAAALGGGAGGVGGGYAGRVGGVGGEGVQQMMQMISSINNGGGLGGGGGGISGVMNAFGGGGGGGLIPGVMNAIGGGGVGGGQDLLQTLMNAGGGIGGGGLDTMTSLLDGMGGGGLDTMASLLGGDGGGALDILGSLLG